MADREVEVLANDGGGLRLRLVGSACDGCAGGCAGRCNLFATDAAGELAMPVPPGCDATAGQRFRLSLDDAVLRRAAWRGYGVAWLGMVLGAGAGYALGHAWGRHGDVLTLCGLLAGTFIAVVSSKRHLPEPRLLPIDRVPNPTPHLSDRP